MPTQEPELVFFSNALCVQSWISETVRSQVFSDIFFGLAQTFYKYLNILEAFGFGTTRYGQVERLRGTELTDLPVISMYH